MELQKVAAQQQQGMSQQLQSEQQQRMDAERRAQTRPSSRAFAVRYWVV